MEQNRNKKKSISGVDNFTMPDTKDLECQVLADLISDPTYLPTATGAVKREMFSDEAYQHVWDVLNEMQSKNETIDLVSVSSRVNADTMAMLMNARLGTASGLTLDAHCKALAEMFTRRLICSSAWEMLQTARNNESDFNDLIARPGKLVEALSANIRSGASTKHISQVLKELVESIEAEENARESGKRTRIPTGFPMLDTLTYSGLKAGQLAVIAARPSVGKTAVMLQMALAATRSGFPATILTLEMSDQEVAQRMLFSTGLVGPRGILENAVEWERLEKAVGRFDNLPLFINEKPMGLDEICSTITLNHQRGMCDIAFIDYLTLIGRDNPKQILYQAVGDMTRRLKQVAKECGIPVVVLSQLNRASELENRSPQLCDLRESGSIEQDADIVLMLERETRSNDDPKVNMWVRKNRQGKAGNLCILLEANDTFTEFHQREVEASDGIKPKSSEIC